MKEKVGNTIIKIIGVFMAIGALIVFIWNMRYLWDFITGGPIRISQ